MGFRLTLRAVCFKEEEFKVEVVTPVQETSWFLSLRMRIGRREGGEDREEFY